MDQQPTTSDAVSSVEKQRIPTPPPPESQFGGWMPTVALTGLGIAFLASTSGIIVSILYLAKKIAANDNSMLGIAQSFMLFASILSMAYIGYHIRATRAGNTLYGILDSQGRKTLHPVHARTRMLIISATSVWMLTIILLAVGIYFGGGGSKTVLLNMDLFASIMASLALSIECYVVFRVDPPFLLPWLSPWDARIRPRGFDSEENPTSIKIVPMDRFAQGFDASILERRSSPARSARPKSPTHVSAAHVSLPPSPTPSRPGGPRPMMPAKSDSILSGSTLHDGQSVHGVSGSGYTLPKPPSATYRNTEPQRIGPEAPVLQTSGHNYTNSAEIFTNVPLSPSPYLAQSPQPWSPQPVVTQTSPTMANSQAPHPPPAPNMTYAGALQQQQQQQPGHYYQQHPQHHHHYQPYSPQQYHCGPHPQDQHAPAQQPAHCQHQYQYPPSQSPTQWVYPQQPAAVYGTTGTGNVSPMSATTDYRDANSEPVSPITRQNSGMSAQVRSMPGTFRDGG
ncbi:hypothetical protein QBC32DRAFT_17951 [Pseudoneurospora amorphoporcata]|uniref:Uncharacterized protein n=1 Tax=Pseudoneurospora amorphoporcata TaxID=241081 RepID=A0AAN6NR59_9PEZI|nr:hypothetical protein QBC32DRAFT_17951 [Pseudoneurospora amorphoporcata]